MMGVGAVGCGKQKSNGRSRRSHKHTGSLFFLQHWFEVISGPTANMAASWEEWKVGQGQSVTTKQRGIDPRSILGRILLNDSFKTACGGNMLRCAKDVQARMETRMQRPLPILIVWYLRKRSMFCQNRVPNSKQTNRSNLKQKSSGWSVRFSRNNHDYSFISFDHRVIFQIVCSVIDAILGNGQQQIRILSEMFGAHKLDGPYGLAMHPIAMKSNDTKCTPCNAQKIIASDRYAWNTLWNPQDPGVPRFREIHGLHGFLYELINQVIID